MNCFIGIDPGKTGGVAVISEDGKVMVSIEMPVTSTKEINSAYLYALFTSIKEETFCVIEKSQSMPKQGVKSTFSYGVGYGEVRAVLKASLTPFQEVAPATWKKEFNLIKKAKMDSCDTAQKLFPSESFLTERGRMMDGKAEALLLAEYARRLSCRK